MPLSPSGPTLDRDFVAASRLHLATRILQLAGNDAALAAQIRDMLWAEYCEAGAPRGVSEDGMYVWWNESLEEAVV